MDKSLMKDGLMDAHTDGKDNYWVFSSFFLREEKTEDGIKCEIIQYYTEIPKALKKNDKITTTVRINNEGSRIF